MADQRTAPSPSGQSSKHAIAYRADIDGLRAIAVVPIVLFHAGVSAIGGGFIGVDIFFVISGFLITAIISREMHQSRFSLLVFYQRRIVRILPALFAMLIAVLIAGMVLLLPTELRDLGKSASAATGFLSNVYFWKTTNYFASASDAKPLLHTWSLGVEEQFYLFYPLALILIRKALPNYLTPVLWMAVVGSFLLGGALSYLVPGGAAAFYLLPPRAWELGLGGLVALGSFPAVQTFKIRSLLSVIGCALILVGIFVVRAGTAFPVPMALLPCVGAALLLAYGKDAVTTTWLSAKPFVAIGQISYSLYLWHWPIIVFYRVQYGDELTPYATLLLIALSTVAAILSRFLFELPAQRRFRSASAARVTFAGVVLIGALMLVGLAVAKESFKIVGLSPDIAHIANYADYDTTREWAYQYRKGVCFAGEGEAFNIDRCLRLDPHKRNVVVLGDSHAAEYWRAIQLALPDANVMEAAVSGCRPTLHAKGPLRCTSLVKYVLGALVDTGEVDTIVLGGRWKQGDIADVSPTLAYLKGKAVNTVVIGPTAEYDGELPQILARSMIARDPGETDRRQNRGRASVDHFLGVAVAQEGVRYVSAYAIECPGSKCRTRAPDGAPMAFDYGHLTLPGSKYVIDQARPSFSAAR